jgi:hypothetical protein
VNKEIFYFRSEKRVSGGTLTYETLLSGVLKAFIYSLYSAYYTAIIRRIREINCSAESSYRRLFSRRLAFFGIWIFVFGTGLAMRRSSFGLSISPLIFRTRFRFFANLLWQARFLKIRFFCFSHGFVRNRPASILRVPERTFNKFSLFSRNAQKC